MTRASLFVLETLSQVRRFTPSGVREARERARLLGWIAENLCALHGIQVMVRGQVPKSPAILVANHSSYIDPLAILSQVPANAVAKHEIGGWPLLGEGVRGLGVLLVDRDCGQSGARVLREALRMLNAGVSVLAFPEGTTTIGDRVLPFKRGVFGLARLTGAPVVPVALRYESEAPCWVGDEAFLPHYVRTTARTTTRVEVTFGAPLTTTSTAQPKTPEHLAEEARSAIQRMLHLPASAAVHPLASVSSRSSNDSSTASRVTHASSG